MHPRYAAGICMALSELTNKAKAADLGSNQLLLGPGCQAPTLEIRKGESMAFTMKKIAIPKRLLLNSISMLLFRLKSW